MVFTHGALQKVSKQHSSKVISGCIAVLPKQIQGFNAIEVSYFMVPVTLIDKPFYMYLKSGMLQFVHHIILKTMPGVGGGGGGSSNFSFMSAQFGISYNKRVSRGGILQD